MRRASWWVSCLLFGCSSTTNIIVGSNGDGGSEGHDVSIDTIVVDTGDASSADAADAADSSDVDSGPIGEAVYPDCTSTATDVCKPMGTDAILLPDLGFCRGLRTLPPSTGHAVLSLIVDTSKLTCAITLRAGVALDGGSEETNFDVNVKPGDSLVTVSFPTPKPGPLNLRLTNTGSCGQIIARTSPLHFYP